jgi:hypothetical protein
VTFGQRLIGVFVPNEKLGGGAVEGEANAGDVGNFYEGEVGIEDVGGGGAANAEFLEEEVVAFDAFVVEEVVEVECKHGKGLRLGAKVVKAGNTIVITHNAGERTTNAVYKTTNRVEKTTKKVERTTNMLERTTNLVERTTNFVEKTTNVL